MENVESGKSQRFVLTPRNKFSLKCLACICHQLLDCEPSMFWGFDCETNLREEIRVIQHWVKQWIIIPLDRKGNLCLLQEAEPFACRAYCGFTWQLSHFVYFWEWEILFFFLICFMWVICVNNVTFFAHVSFKILKTYGKKLFSTVVYVH